MKPGDRIVSFGGRKINSWDDATQLIRGHGPGPSPSASSATASS